MSGDMGDVGVIWRGCQVAGDAGRGGEMGDRLGLSLGLGRVR
jgi:hypothetical protein